MLRLHDRGISDRAIPELFHRIPSTPSLLSLVRARAGARARGPSGPGLPARGRSRRSASRPSTWGSARQMLQLFRILSSGVTPRPAQAVPPSPFLLGSCLPPFGEPDCSQDSGRGERPGWGLEGREEEKGKAEAREIRRREKSRAGRKRRGRGWWRALFGSRHCAASQAGRAELGEREPGRSVPGRPEGCGTQLRADLTSPERPAAAAQVRPRRPAARPGPFAGSPPGALSALPASGPAEPRACGPCALGARGGEALGTLRAGTRGRAWRCTPSPASRWSACSALATCRGTGPSQAWLPTGPPRPASNPRRLHLSLPTSSSSSPTTRDITMWATMAQISRPLRWTGWPPRVSNWRIIISSLSARLRGANFSLAGRHGPGCWGWPSKLQINPVVDFPCIYSCPSGIR